jgi:UDP-galactose transporter B1
MNDKPKFQVLTAGGAGVTKSSGRRATTTKTSTQPTKSVLSSDSESNSNTLIPLLSQNQPSKGSSNNNEDGRELEYEVPLDDDDDENAAETVQDVALNDDRRSKNNSSNDRKGTYSDNRKVTFASQQLHTSAASGPPLSSKVGDSRNINTTPTTGVSDLVWLIICFIGIMASFVCYGLLLEYTTSGGRKLHELSFLFITSGLYTITAAAGRYVRDETPTTIPPRQFALLGLTSMGSTWCSVRSLRYVLQIH